MSRRAGDLRLQNLRVPAHLTSFRRLETGRTGSAEPRIRTTLQVRVRQSRRHRKEPSRKVRTPQGTAVGNAHPGKPAGKCHREQTADGAATREPRTGKGETVR